MTMMMMMSDRQRERKNKRSGVTFQSVVAPHRLRRRLTSVISPKPQSLRALTSLGINGKAIDSGFHMSKLNSSSQELHTPKNHFHIPCFRSDHTFVSKLLHLHRLFPPQRPYPIPLIPTPDSHFARSYPSTRPACRLRLFLHNLTKLVHGEFPEFFDKGSRGSEERGHHP